MIKIYGSPRSSAGRCYLMLEELHLPYEAVQLDMMGKREHKSENYLQLNPNGKIPCLVDGDFVIWESMAINSYLADKYKPELLGSTPETRGRATQWSYWALGELQAPLVKMLIQLLFTPEEKRDMNAVAEARDRAPALLRILDSGLQNHAYVAGNELTVADFNVASVVHLASSLKIPLESFSRIESWMGRMKERPSFKKFMELRHQ